MKRLVLCALAVVGIAVAASKTYNVKLFQAAMVGNVELTPGEYQVQVVDEAKVVFRNGRLHGEAPVKVEIAGEKYSKTSVRMTADTRKIIEIRLGGTKTKLVFTE